MSARVLNALPGSLTRDLMRLLLVATFLLLWIADPAAAQPTRVLDQANAEITVRGLEAQYQAALIRERRLADDREQTLIADAEARLRRARAEVDAVRGDTVAAQEELSAARRDYATLVEQIAQRDAGTRAEIETYRREAAQLVARSDPQRAAALQRFADGDRVGAWPIIEELTRASVRARLLAADAAAAADLAEIERLRLEVESPSPHP